MMTRFLGLPLLCGVFIVLWSSGFVGAKFGLDHAGTFTILFWRYLLVTAILAVLVTLAKQWQRIPRGVIGRHMLVGALAHAGWLAAVLGAIDLGLSAGLAAFITALQPILTGALSARMTGEQVSGREWAGLGLGLVAVALVIGDGIALGGAVVAHLLPFLAVIAITLASLIDRSGNLKKEKSVPILLATFLHCLASFLVLAPLAVGLEGLEATWNGSLVFAIIWLAVVVSLAAYGLMFVLLRRLPASQVASLTYLSPPVTMIMAWIVFGEVLSMMGIIGLGIAAAAVFLTLTSSKREPEEVESPLHVEAAGNAPAICN
ncbi:EamA family transporter [Rhodobacteraceae bacterium Araon29]